MAGQLVSRAVTSSRIEMRTSKLPTPTMNVDSTLLRRADLSTIGASQTNSRRHGKVGTTAYPAFAVSGDGAVLTFQDGRTAIDLAGANGAIALGYQHPEVTDWVRRYSNKGGTLSLPSPLEVEASSMMCDAFDMDARVRWVRTALPSASRKKILGIVALAYSMARITGGIRGLVRSSLWVTSYSCLLSIGLLRFSYPTVSHRLRLFSSSHHDGHRQGPSTWNACASFVNTA